MENFIIRNFKRGYVYINEESSPFSRKSDSKREKNYRTNIRQQYSTSHGKEQSYLLKVEKTCDAHLWKYVRSAHNNKAVNEEVVDLCRVISLRVSYFSFPMLLNQVSS
jgi:hypothetical protein